MAIKMTSHEKFKYLSEITTELKVAYTYIVVPTVMMDTPVETDKMALVDENNNDVGYGTLNELSDTLGSLFSPVNIIDERFTLFRWLIAMDEVSESRMVEFLLGNDLVRMRQPDQAVAEIDYSSLNGNEFMICDAFAIKDVPKIKISQ